MLVDSNKCNLTHLEFSYNSLTYRLPQQMVFQQLSSQLDLVGLRQARDTVEELIKLSRKLPMSASKIS